MPSWPTKRNVGLYKYVMRSFIDIINESVLLESIEFHPATISDDGMEINFPANSVVRKSSPCPECKGTGKDLYAAEQGRDQKCYDCFGAKTITDTEYKFPSMGVSNENAQIVCDLIGVEYDSHGWIAPEHIPAILRRLIYVKNKPTDGFERESSENQGTVMDRTGEIPQIRRTATLIDAGVSADQVMRYIDKMIEICQWAKQNDCGVSWA